MNAVLNNAIKNINSLYDVVGEIQGRLKKLEDKQVHSLIGLPDLTVDTQVLVRDYNDEDWRRGYFKCWTDGFCICFSNGGTSWSTVCTTSWKYWKIPEEDNK